MQIGIYFAILVVGVLLGVILMTVLGMRRRPREDRHLAPKWHYLEDATTDWYEARKALKPGAAITPTGVPLQFVPVAEEPKKGGKKNATNRKDVKAVQARRKAKRSGGKVEPARQAARN